MLDTFSLIKVAIGLFLPHLGVEGAGRVLCVGGPPDASFWPSLT